MGMQALKNVAEPMRAWRVRLGVVCVDVDETVYGLLNLSPFPTDPPLLFCHSPT